MLLTRLQKLSENFPMFHFESVTSIDLLSELMVLNLFTFLTLPRFLIPVFTLYIVCVRVSVSESERLGTHQQAAQLFSGFKGCFLYSFIYLFFITITVV